MRESELLSHIYERSRGLVAPGARVIVGPGDDCAVVDVGTNSSDFGGPAGVATGQAASLFANQLLLKVDQVVEGRHFTSDTPIDLIARKAVADGKDLNATSYLVTQRISDSKTVNFRVGVAVVGDRLVYLLANPSGSFDFSDDAWKGIVGRATQRVTQFP